MGAGRALVTATGMQTEFGRIAQLLQTVETGKTPLQQNLDKVGTVLVRATSGCGALIVALGLMRGQPLIEMLIFGIAPGSRCRSGSPARRSHDFAGDRRAEDGQTQCAHPPAAGCGNPRQHIGDLFG